MVSLGVTLITIWRGRAGETTLKVTLFRQLDRDAGLG